MISQFKVSVRKYGVCGEIFYYKDDITDRMVLIVDYRGVVQCEREQVLDVELHRWVGGPVPVQAEEPDVK